MKEDTISGHQTITIKTAVAAAVWVFCLTSLFLTYYSRLDWVHKGIQKRTYGEWWNRISCMPDVFMLPNQQQCQSIQRETSCRREAATICPRPLWPWPWKWCPSHVWRGLSLPILVYLGLSVLDLGPTYATDRHQTALLLNAPGLGGGGAGHNKHRSCTCKQIGRNLQQWQMI